MRVPNRVLQSRNPDLKISSNPVISRAIFGIPPPAHTFNPESLPDFALKSRIPSFKLGKSRIPENLLGTLFNDHTRNSITTHYFIDERGQHAAAGDIATNTLEFLNINV